MSADDLKRMAAARAVEAVTDGMRLGLGTGSTAKHFVALLGDRVRGGLDVVGVPTSEATHAQALAEGIALTTLDETPELDLTVDGADELDASLRLIKGGGGALLREKIVAAASARMIVIADAGKKVDTLGRFPLPIEVNPFGLEATRRAVAHVLETHGLPTAMRLRTAANGTVFVTDGGHHILDAELGAIEAPEALAEALVAVPGVVEHGLFIGLATGAILAGDDGVVEYGAI
ncbi:MAG TPA: ribose-5-phosphate isomerase RpiA [Saliniramus sp.]|nr:ribose-5-phosphate isomerase RpiA [Saliniramus sp.]HMB12085.1 ribose-5-phosphate isomerase RpiA [Saliniramus sp.]